MKKSLKIILTLVLVLASVFGLSKIRSAHADGATGKIQITSKTITPTKSPVDQYTDIKVDLTFNVPNGVKPGDQAVITLPPNLKFIKDAEFEVRSPNGELVSEAVINAANKTITLTYQDYVKGKSNISGSMFFAVRVEPATASPSKVPITLNVDNNPVPVGEVDFVVDPGNAEKVLDKVSWDTKHLADGGITRQYEVRVNATKEPLTEAVVTDQLQTEGMSYVEDSFVIKKGNWAVNSSHKLDLKNGQVVSLPVEFGADKKSFKVSLGNVAQGEGYSIVYKVKIPYTPANDEKFFNNVTLNAKKVVETKSNPFVYQTEGGKAQGYTFSINLKKVDGQDENTALAGAEFNVIRVATGAVVGKLTTNAKGEASIGGLLNTAYQLVETKAPEGYQLSTEEIKVKPEDFGATKSVTKDIINKKNEKASAQLQVQKELIGRKLKDQEFQFELKKDGEQNPLQTKTNDANGKVTFEPITYTEEGTHKYIISEKKSLTPERGIYYDPEDIQVTVKVSRNQAGKLVTEVTYQGNGANGQLEKKDTFTNHYIPDKTSTKLSATKKLVGRDLQNGEFEFELKDLQNNNKILETVKNKADGKVEFKEIEYTKAGTYNYTITEKSGNVAGVEYDPNLISVTVKVEDQGGKLKVTKVTYSEANEEIEKPIFINRYTPGKTFARLEVNKILTGRQLQKDEFHIYHAIKKQNCRVL